MTTSNSSTVTSGVSVFGLLGVLFIGLKLTHVIDWSWWWVLLPFYWGLAVVAAVISVYILVSIVAGLTIFILTVRDEWQDRKRRRR